MRRFKTFSTNSKIRFELSVTINQLLIWICEETDDFLYFSIKEIIMDLNYNEITDYNYLQLVHMK